MEQDIATKNRQILARYLPEAAVEPVFNYLSGNHIFLHITPERRSKLGDYRWPQARHQYHEISINGNLNPYHFLMVMLHEMAHHDTYLAYGTAVQPHGHEWQEAYRVQLLRYLYVFPADIQTLLVRYTHRIPLSHTIAAQVDELLRHHDPNYHASQELTLDDLQPGDTFRLLDHPDRHFRAIERRRTRWLCESVDTQQQFLVRGAAQVKKTS